LIAEKYGVSEAHCINIVRGNRRQTVTQLPVGKNKSQLLIGNSKYRVVKFNNELYAWNDPRNGKKISEQIEQTIKPLRSTKTKSKVMSFDIKLTVNGQVPSPKLLDYLSSMM